MIEVRSVSHDFDGIRFYIMGCLAWSDPTPYAI